MLCYLLHILFCMQRFFQLRKNTECEQNANLRSSNLSHHAALIHVCTHVSGVTDILSHCLASDRSGRRLVVDVVAFHGRVWLKVVARKGHALHLAWAGTLCHLRFSLLCNEHRFFFMFWIINRKLHICLVHTIPFLWFNKCI